MKACSSCAARSQALSRESPKQEGTHPTRDPVLYPFTIARMHAHIPLSTVEFAISTSLNLGRGISPSTRSAYAESGIREKDDAMISLATAINRTGPSSPDGKSFRLAL